MALDAHPVLPAIYRAGPPLSRLRLKVAERLAQDLRVLGEVETEEKVTVARARELFERFPGLRLWDNPGQDRYPMSVMVEGQDDCFVGRIREDLSTDHGLNFWVVGDQLRKGAATNAVQIAELLVGLGV